MVLGSILRFILTKIGKKRLPVINGELKITGLLNTVEVFRDPYGVPHIFAKNIYDLFFAQGFVQAQDRLWQMEIYRRTAEGTLSEIFGDIALDTDRAARTFGFARTGIADIKDLNEEFISYLQAFTDGVNAFLNHSSSKLPVEFSLTRHKPEPWKLEDIASISRIMLWQLSHAWYGEIIRAKIISSVGEEHAAELEFNYPQNNPLTLPYGIEFNTLDESGILQKNEGPFLKRGLGSNSWVISAQKSMSNHAYLCNDMHLPLSLPGIWYETHLHSPEIKAAGVSLAGVPCILVGHNDCIAWGSTLAFTDAEDLFVEKFNPDNPTQYEYQGKWIDSEIIQEEIKIKGQSSPYIENVIITRHGPVISEVINYPEQRIAVSSMALRPSQALKGYLLLNKVKNWDDFVNAIKFITATQLNMTYADVNDNIGYWVTGKLPIRAKGNGSMPVPGWSGEYEWINEIPFEEMPHTLNPKDGYLVTCNHRIVPDDYPYFLSTIWMNGYRAKRFKEIIKDKEKLSVEDFKSMQLDYKCLSGLEFVTHLKDLKSTDIDVQLALDYLKSWDGNHLADSVSGSIYEVTRYFIIRDLFERGLGEELTKTLMGAGFHPVLYHSHEFAGYDTVILLRLLDNPDSWWIQNAGGKEQLLLRNLKKAIVWIKTNLGKSPNDKWKWGNLHRATFEHAMALKKPLDKVFNRGNVPMGGNTDTLCQTASLPDKTYEVSGWAASHRQIIDLNDFSNSLMIVPPGQSGHLASPHYDDMIEPWVKGQYHTMLWKKEEIKNQSKAKLTLTP